MTIPTTLWNDLADHLAACHRTTDQLRLWYHAHPRPLSLEVYLAAFGEGLLRRHQAIYTSPQKHS